MLRLLEYIVVGIANNFIPVVLFFAAILFIAIIIEYWFYILIAISLLIFLCIKYCNTGDNKLSDTIKDDPYDLLKDK